MLILELNSSLCHLRGYIFNFFYCFFQFFLVWVVAVCSFQQVCTKILTRGPVNVRHFTCPPTIQTSF